MGKLGFQNNVEFTLDSQELGSEILEQDPLNWDSDEKTYTYDNVWGGTLAKVNTSLQFVGEGYDYFKKLLLGFGFGTQATVTKWMKDPTKLGEDWRVAYQSNIEINKTEFDESRTTPIAKVSFTQGGLYDILKSRYSTKFDLASTKDADGNDIGGLKTIEETVSGREIFRISKGTVDDGVRKRHIVTGADKDNATAVPFSFKPNSDSDNIANVYIETAHVGYNNGDYATGSLASLTFLPQDRHHERKLNGRIKIKIIDGDRGRIRIQKVLYKYNRDTSTYEFTGKNENLADINADSFGSFLQYDFVDEPLELEKDECMAFVIFSSTNDGIEYQYYDTYLNITEDDTFISTRAKALLPHEFFDRMLEKITGEKGLLISNVFGRRDLGYKEDGEWAYLAMSSGFWGRGFDIGPPIKNPETGENEPLKQFNSSLRDAYESFYTVFPMTAAVQKIKGKEYFRIEPYEFTQQDFVGVRMGRQLPSGFQHIPASKAVTTVLEENIFTGVKIGYEKGGKDYEEVSGLSSPHGQADFSFALKYQDENQYSKLSKIRADLEGYDLARRKQAIDYPDTDTSYDQDLFFRHLKKVGTQFVMRTWEDDLAEPPQGEAVYSPDTMGNLLLTPFRCLKRHGRILATSVIGKPYGKVVFTGSNCFSSLITKRIGGNAVQEDGFILNKDLGSPFINGMLLSFNGKVYQSMIDEFEGYQIIDGEKVPNWYGRFEVMVGGTLQYGRLISSNISGEGKHEIALI